MVSSRHLIQESQVLLKILVYWSGRYQDTLPQMKFIQSPITSFRLDTSKWESRIQESQLVSTSTRPFEVQSPRVWLVSAD